MENIAKVGSITGVVEALVTTSVRLFFVERGVAFANQWQAEFRPWDRLLDSIVEVDIVITDFFWYRERFRDSVAQYLRMP